MELRKLVIWKQNHPDTHTSKLNVLAKFGATHWDTHTHTFDVSTQTSASTASLSCVLELLEALAVWWYVRRRGWSVRFYVVDGEGRMREVERGEWQGGRESGSKRRGNAFMVIRTHKGRRKEIQFYARGDGDEMRDTAAAGSEKTTRSRSTVESHSCDAGSCPGTSSPPFYTDYTPETNTTTNTDNGFWDLWLPKTRFRGFPQRTVQERYQGGGTTPAKLWRHVRVPLALVVTPKEAWHVSLVFSKGRVEGNAPQGVSDMAYGDGASEGL
ncbi:hypothetical protein BDV95DRAFT_573964 [Massariosphaeria phaeospora]|uniref:Uncharacterized protein n=1 Tax=Massariosphaeria phaeospora TaxID=100035 RepID=A0A7C8M732_9PLEO|nr:hypothetical protein BDV95DRAFT_573964 [Massariosphaeria phaeospora]